MEIFPSMDPTMLFASDEITEEKSDFLCIGQKAAYFCQSRHFVNIVEGGGMYGFDGITNLCKLLVDAYSNPKDLKLTISHKGMACESCL